ncbi:hypothetical protein HDK77DRAFT_481245 [Phyllosticta capitalensis]|uniref:Uncharacterized protein n=1 Tax=Phyllosticta capitalensis TaxID=121624 RepID=A0ABR1Z332_9PEZI
MPVRWTDDKKALLFVTIMNTHQLSVDAKLVVDAWPDNEGEKPTERAIREILIKTKKKVANKSTGGSASSTPTKVKVSKPRAKPTPRSAKKRKQMEENDDSDSPSPSGSRKELKDLGGASPTPKRGDSVVETGYLVPDNDADMGVTDGVGYPTPADTASPAVLPRRATPRRAASVKVGSYVKAEQNGSDDEDESRDDASDPELDNSDNEWGIGALVDEM